MHFLFTRRSRLVLFLCFLIALTCSAAHAQKIKVEYDKSIDFSKFKTFAIDPAESPSKPMLRLAIQAAVQDDLGKRGLTKVDADPDLYVQMYGAIDTDITAHYHDPIYGGAIPPMNSGITLWHNIPGTVTTVVIPNGELGVDVFGAREKSSIVLA